MTRPDDRFSARARRAIELAAVEAREELHHDHIGTEHLLLGLLHEEVALFSPIVESKDVTLAWAREQVATLIPRGDAQPKWDIFPFTPRMQRTLGRAEGYAGDVEVEPEHLFRALVADPDGVASQILATRGITAEAL